VRDGFKLDGKIGKKRIDGLYLSGRYCCILISMIRKVGPRRAFQALKFGTTNFEGNLIARSEKIRKAKV